MKSLQAKDGLITEVSVVCVNGEYGSLVTYGFGFVIPGDGRQFMVKDPAIDDENNTSKNSGNENLFKERLS